MPDLIAPLPILVNAARLNHRANRPEVKFCVERAREVYELSDAEKAKRLKELLDKPGV